MKYCVAVVLFIGTLTAISQTPNPPATPPSAPKLSDTVKLHFFKAQSEFQAAQDQAKQATDAAQSKSAALQAVVKEVQDACGKDFQPQLGQDGDLICIPKPPEPAKTEAPAPAAKK